MDFIAVKENAEKGPVDLIDSSLFDYMTILPVIDCIQHSGEISIWNT